jgi:hypothetical protein
MRFRPESLDSKSFMEAVLLHSDCQDCGCKHGVDDDLCSCFYWYLTPGNCTLNPDGTLSINHNKAKSAHSFRSLRATIIAINKFILVDLSVWGFTVMDECNPQYGWQIYLLKFAPNHSGDPKEGPKEGRVAPSRPPVPPVVITKIERNSPLSIFPTEDDPGVVNMAHLGGRKETPLDKVEKLALLWEIEQAGFPKK